jgi:hypothetical protein
MKSHASGGHRGPLVPNAMALLLLWAVGCSDDAEEAAAGGSAGAGATAGASGSAGAGGAAGSSGGGTGGTQAAGGSAGSSSGGSGGGSGSNGLSGNGGGGTAGGGAASVDAGTEPDGGAGELQRCETATACLEFRGHSPTCQIGNAANCVNIVNGTYFVGPCPTDQFEFAAVEETFCGPTGGFLRRSP